METLSAWLALFEWNSPITGEFPSQRPVTRSRPSRRRWFETPLRPLWRHRNFGTINLHSKAGAIPIWNAIYRRRDTHYKDRTVPPTTSWSFITGTVIPWNNDDVIKWIFSALLALCAGNSPVTDEIISQRPMTRSFDVFFDLRLNTRLNKPSRRRWFETPLRPLWRHRNFGTINLYSKARAISIWNTVLPA